MGVMQCDVIGCDNVMCDKLSRKYGYICNDHYQELLNTNGDISIEDFFYNGGGSFDNSWQFIVEDEFIEL